MSDEYLQPGTYYRVDGSGRMWTIRQTIGRPSDRFVWVLVEIDGAVPLVEQLGDGDLVVWSAAVWNEDGQMDDWLSNLDGVWLVFNTAEECIAEMYHQWGQGD